MKYLFEFIKQYSRYGHDDAPFEKEADKGYNIFNEFNSFVNARFGSRAIEKLFNSDEREYQKIQTLTEWWDTYQESKNQKTKPFLEGFSNLEEGTYKWDGRDWIKQ